MMGQTLEAILNSSKEYKMYGSILELTHYNTGERIQLDLSVLLNNPDVLEEMIVVEEDEEEWE